MVQAAKPIFFMILMVCAIAQSFSYHLKYAALFSANRAYVFLNNYIDVQVVSLALGGSPDAKQLTLDVLAEIEDIEKTTAAAYGKTHSTLDISD